MCRTNPLAEERAARALCRGERLRREPIVGFRNKIGFGPEDRGVSTSPQEPLMTDKTISPLRQRMIEDMSVRSFDP